MGFLNSETLEAFISPYKEFDVSPIAPFKDLEMYGVSQNPDK